MTLQLANPYPSTGLWRHEDFALAAYWLNQQTASADAGLIDCLSNGLFQTSITVEDFHWHAYLQERIYFLFSAQSDFFPGRMSPAAENAVLEMLWDWAAPNCKIGMADPAYINYHWGSENHHLQAWVSFWGAAQIFSNHPLYSTYTYADGSTPAEMAAAFDAYFKAWFRDRSVKGLLVEVNSPIYAKYSLNTLFNLADFATDPELKTAAGAMLDIYFADWAMDQIDGVRGGSRHRCYPGPYSDTHPGGGAEHAWYMFGVGSGPNTHPGAMGGMTTFWRPSRAAIGLALDTSGRGSYGYASRRLGLADLSAETPPVYGGSAMDPDGGSLLRYTWCTPDFVMGMSQMEARSAADWMGISSQNRWNGVIFGGHNTARIFTQRPDPASGSVYNEEWGVQHKGAMILQHLKAAQGSTAQMVWFDSSLSREEISGWIFAEAPRAYAAVKILDGGWSWNGSFAVLTNKYSPIIMEVGRKQDYDSFAAFRSEIMANSLVWNGSRLDYTSTGYDTTLTLFTDESAPPQVDGTFIDFNPKKAYDAPYLQGEFGGGPVIINYGDDRTVHGVAPFADDANTFAHWDFETTVPLVHPDSANSVQPIADGKFGGAIRCNDEAGDQYMMSSSAWPTNQGTVRYQGWIRLNPGDTGGCLFHVGDQVDLSVGPSNVSFSINKNGVPEDGSATNLITRSAAISASGDWQYIEAVYDGDQIKLVTEKQTVTAPGIGVFVPNNRNVYIGARINTSNYVGDMDEVKVSSSVTQGYVVPAPVVVAGSAVNYQSSAIFNTRAGFAPATGSGTKLVVCASWESAFTITNITYGGQSFTPAIRALAGRNASIWYLDAPALPVGDVVVRFNGNVSSRIGVLSLRNAAAGDPVRTASAGSSTTIALFSPVENSLAVGVYTENAGASLSSGFSNTLYSGNSGSSVGNAGYQVEALAGAKTYRWNANTNACVAVAASFAPVTVAPPIIAGDDADNDADGMADEWELQQFGTMGAADGSGDADGDGFTDAQEFNAGTGPRDAASRLELTAFNGGTNLFWQAVQGKRYRVLSSTNLTGGAWDEAASDILGTPPESSYVLTHSTDNIFIKVEVE